MFLPFFFSNFLFLSKKIMCTNWVGWERVLFFFAHIIPLLTGWVPSVEKSFRAVAFVLKEKRKKKEFGDDSEMKDDSRSGWELDRWKTTVGGGDGQQSYPDG
jgi:hypothetical protein